MKIMVLAATLAVSSFSHVNAVQAEDYPSIPQPNYNMNASNHIANSLTILDQNINQGNQNQDYFVTENGNVYVDDLDDPKCTFYLNYSEVSGNIYQEANVGTVNLVCY